MSKSKDKEVIEEIAQYRAKGDTGLTREEAEALAAQIQAESE